MSATTTADLTAVPVDVLERVAREVGSAALPCPLGRLELELRGYDGHAAALATALADLERDAALRFVQAVLAERARERPSPIELVWTGPEGRHAVSRHTSIVLRELFDKAEHAIVIAGFRFDHCAVLLAPLHEAMVTRDVSVRMFVDVPAPKRTRLRTRSRIREHPAATTADVGLELDRLLDKMWTFAPPRPALYFDPRTATITTPGQGVSMHAKCVVVDNRWSLVGSANFTRRGQERNYELGVVIDNRVLAREIVGHWNALVSNGTFLRHQ